MSTLTTETEVELKYRIEDPGALGAIAVACAAPEAWFRQTNHYLDDAARSLRAARLMLRAREIWFPPGTPSAGTKPPVTFTAKRRISAEGGLFTALERSQVMPLDVWQDILSQPHVPAVGPLFDWLRGELPFGPLARIGATVTMRRKVQSGFFMLELDHTTYPDGSSDLELECETYAPDLARAHIEELLTRLGVTFAPATEGKYARFLARAADGAGTAS
jgi:uncharacterized protein YjbK